MTKVYKHDVFISYSPASTVFARDLAKRLQEMDFNVWTPHRVAAQQSTKIVRALENSAVCVLLFSSDGESPWTDRTVWSAISDRVHRTEGRFRVIPILFHDRDTGRKELKPSWTASFANTMQHRGAFIRFDRDVTDDAVNHLVLRIRGVHDAEPSWRMTLKDQIRFQAKSLKRVNPSGLPRMLGEDFSFCSMLTSLASGHFDSKEERVSNVARLHEDDHPQRQDSYILTDIPGTIQRAQQKNQMDAVVAWPTLRERKGHGDLLWPLHRCGIPSIELTNIVKFPYDSRANLSERISGADTSGVVPINNMRWMTLSYQIKKEGSQHDRYEMIRKLFCSDLAEESLIKILATCRSYLRSCEYFLPPIPLMLSLHPEIGSLVNQLALYLNLQKNSANWQVEPSAHDGLNLMPCRNNADVDFETFIFVRSLDYHYAALKYSVDYPALNCDEGDERQNEEFVCLGGTSIARPAEDNVDIGNDRVRCEICQHINQCTGLGGLMENHTKYHVDPTGQFVTGGPQNNLGLTGCKIIVNLYNGYARQRYGTSSRKDLTKGDGSLAYTPRYIARNILAASLLDKWKVQLADATAVGETVSVDVDLADAPTKKREEDLDSVDSFREYLAHFLGFCSREDIDYLSR